jgi:polyisoprenoid-binding protein YceI
MALQTLTIDVAQSWKIDAGNTTVAFAVKNFRVRTVHGRFDRVQGWANTNGAALSDAAIDVEIDPSTIDTGNSRRDKHLRSSDFLDVERYPTISFHSTEVNELGENRLSVMGQLTLHGVTRPVTLDAEVEQRDDRQAKVSATTTLDRRDFGITHNANGFMVGHTVAVTITLSLLAS